MEKLSEVCIQTLHVVEMFLLLVGPFHRKPKRKFYKPSEKLSLGPKIRFIDPGKTEQNAEKVAPIVRSNWEKLKDVITAEPTSCSGRGTTGKRKRVGEGSQKRKAVDSKLSVKKRRKMPRLSVKEESSPVRTSTIWFDDVDPTLREYVSTSIADEETINESEFEKKKVEKSETKLVKPASFEGLTKALAIDCEMVGAGKNSLLARVSIVNSFGHCVYDTFVRPTEKVTDYRTAVSGVRPQDIKDAPSFEAVQKKVFSLVDKRILVGHAIRNDLQVLYLSHPRTLVRDTSRYKEFRNLFNGRTPSLKKLTEKVLGVRIQSGEHDSIEDARAAMRLYTMYKVRWEKHITSKKPRNRNRQRRTAENT